MGRIALVTGGGRGIGRSIALAFAREGAAVAVAARTEDQIAGVRDEIRALGGNAVDILLDVTDPAACAQAIQACTGAFGGLDILVNNAGILESARFLTTSDDSWRRVLDVDLTGAFYMTRAALPVLLERGEGAVIAISSIAAKSGIPYHASYAAAKGGLNSLMRSLAVEYARSGVTFNAVCPAYTETDMVMGSLETAVARTGRHREEILAAWMAPIGRLITPDEVAEVCVLLASRGGHAINGQAINVDGGWIHA